MIFLNDIKQGLNHNKYEIFILEKTNLWMEDDMMIFLNIN